MRLFVLVFLFTTHAYSQVPVYELTLSQALIKAKNKSELLKSVQSDILAAQEKAEGIHTALMPRLTFDANARYVTEVPSFQPVPNGPSVKFGDHLNYSVGPTLSYTLWDGGSSRNSYNGQSKVAEAHIQNKRTQTALLVSEVKLAYTKAQVELEQMKLLSDSVKLTQSQLHDIQNRKQAGSASALDLLTAQKETLNYQLLYKQKQSQLSSSLQDLFALVEDSQHLNTHEPAPHGFTDAKLWIKLDSLEDTLRQEAKDEPAALPDKSPQIKRQDLIIEALELQSKAQESSKYPTIQISARTSLDYPNGPILKRIHQNTLSVGFSMPIYEFSKNQHLAAEKRYEAEATKHRRMQMASDMQRDFAKAKDKLRNLREQDLDAQKIAKQADELAKLNYEAYRFGRINLVEVQASNLKALQAKVDLAQIRAHMLSQLTILKTLSVKDE